MIQAVIRNPPSQHDVYEAIKSLQDAARVVNIPLTRADILVGFDGDCSDEMIDYIEKFGCKVLSKNYSTKGN